MDDEYRDYFSQRIGEVEAYGGPPPPWWSRDPVADDAVQGALEAARGTAERHGLRLRGDAELVIFLLARELVARPVTAVRPTESRELGIDLPKDAEVIVDRAAPDASDGEISAHGVIDALSRLWDELRSGRYRLWDRR